MSTAFPSQQNAIWHYTMEITKDLKIAISTSVKWRILYTVYAAEPFRQFGYCWPHGSLESSVIPKNTVVSTTSSLVLFEEFLRLASQEKSKNIPEVFI